MTSGKKSDPKMLNRSVEGSKTQGRSCRPAVGAGRPFASGGLPVAAMAGSLSVESVRSGAFPCSGSKEKTLRKSVRNVTGDNSAGSRIFQAGRQAPQTMVEFEHNECSLITPSPGSE